MIVRGVCGALAVLLLFAALRVEAWALQPDGLQSGSAVLMDAQTGQVLFEKNMREQRHPASITKILTAMLALENSRVSDGLTASASAVWLPGNSTSICLQAGEQMTVEDALYALMLPSANDAANVLAEHVAGSQAAFADLMNRRAAELGATDTHFTNAHGLTDRQHRTTALDMALITRAAIAVPGFMEYFGAPTYEMAATNLGGMRLLTNYHRMLLRDSPLYNPYVTGGKTGYTVAAGHTLVTTARRDGRTLICVVMGSENGGQFADTQALLEYGFGSFSQATVALPASAVPDTPVLVVEDGAAVGEAVLYPDGDEIVLLLPDDVSPDDVSLRVDLPDSIDRDGRLPVITLEYPAAAGRDAGTLAHEVPLDVRYVWYPAPVVSWEGPTFQDLAIVLYAAVCVSAAVLVTLIFAVLRNRRCGYRRKYRV